MLGSKETGRKCPSYKEDDENVAVRRDDEGRRFEANRTPRVGSLKVLPPSVDREKTVPP